MSTSNLLPVSVVQMGHVEKLVDTIQNQPDALRQVAEETAKQNLADQNKLIEKTDRPEIVNHIRTDADAEKRGKKQGEDLDTPHKKKHTQPGQDHDSPESPDAAWRSNPWAGNIVNTKV